MIVPDEAWGTSCRAAWDDPESPDTYLCSPWGLQAGRVRSGGDGRAMGDAAGRWVEDVQEGAEIPVHAQD